MKANILLITAALALLAWAIFGGETFALAMFVCGAVLVLGGIAAIFLSCVYGMARDLFKMIKGTY